VWRVSNPYLTAGSQDAVNPSGVWTTTTYDALGRATTVRTPDNAQVTTAYSGDTVTVTDQAGKSRRSVTDALGRLKQVVEDPHTLAYATDYTYDALGNLRQVAQGQQRRYFMYDSLSRLIRAKNPEQAVNPNLNTTPDTISGNTQWSLSYVYDANGNLASRTDARGVSASYGYDALNRLTATSYSDGVTPYVGRVYDKSVRGRGRFAWHWTHASAHTVVHEYDQVGRVIAQSQHFWINNGWGPAYTTRRAYDKAGNVTWQQYPSGHTVNYDQFDVVGRLRNFSGNLGDGALRTYATNINYDAAGRMTQERFGTNTPLYHNLHYNVRGQLNDIRLSTAADEWSWNRGMIVNHYGSNDYANWGASGADNNGNVLRSHHYVPDNDQISGWSLNYQDYTYDTLNRLRAVAETSGRNTGGWFNAYRQANVYDRYGNRTLNVETTCGGSQTLATRQFVVSLYQSVLAREADAGGLEMWHDYLSEGYAQGQAELLARARTTVAGFFRSQEYYNRNRPPRDYVYDLYRAYLGRDPDQGGWDAWTQVAATPEGREEALAGFANSGEFANRVGTLCPSGATWGTGINNKEFAVDAGTNRLVVPAGRAGVLGYDAAGHLTTDSYTGQGTRTYDGEGRMTSAASDIYGNRSHYTYDADGRRVRRHLSGGEVWQVYGTEGELLAEYAAGAAPPQRRRSTGIVTASCW
jgi:YD repeat-containing protein